MTTAAVWHATHHHDSALTSVEGAAAPRNMLCGHGEGSAAVEKEFKQRKAGVDLGQPEATTRPHMSS